MDYNGHFLSGLFFNRFHYSHSFPAVQQKTLAGASAYIKALNAFVNIVAGKPSGGGQIHLAGFGERGVERYGYIAEA